MHERHVPHDWCVSNTGIAQTSYFLILSKNYAGVQGVFAKWESLW